MALNWKKCFPNSDTTQHFYLHSSVSAYSTLAHLFLIHDHSPSSFFYIPQVHLPLVHHPSLILPITDTTSQLAFFPLHLLLQFSFHVAEWEIHFQSQTMAISTFTVLRIKAPSSAFSVLCDLTLQRWPLLPHSLTHSTLPCWLYHCVSNETSIFLP
jgi:hypothetical protein